VEFVHTSKGKASQDPLGEAEEIESKLPREKGDEDHGLASITDHSLDPGYDDDSDTDNGPEFDDDIFDSSDEENEDKDNTVDDDNVSGKGTGTGTDLDSGYNSDRTDVSIKEGGREPAQQGCNTNEFGESTQMYKVLCYEDIIL
jgi:hypothetical protein